MGVTVIALFLLVLCPENVADCFGRQFCGDLIDFVKKIHPRSFAAASRCDGGNGEAAADTRTLNNQSILVSYGSIDGDSGKEVKYMGKLLTQQSMQMVLFVGCNESKMKKVE